MWDKLLALFKDTQSDDNYIPASIAKREARRQELSKLSAPVESTIDNQQGKGTLIGFNYLKGLEDEQDANLSRRFINLNKLLRGEYKNEQTQETTRESQSDLRGKNT